VLLAAVAATAADAALLQRKRSYFTGGFLSVEHVSSLWQAVAFFIGSLVADVAVVGVTALAGLWFARRLRLGPRAAMAMTFVVALFPIAAIDFVTYEIQSFLGDAFDLNLMFDLAGEARPKSLPWARRTSHGRCSSLGGAFSQSCRSRGSCGDDARVRRLTFRSCPSDREPQAALVLVAAGSVTVAALRAGSDVLDEGLRRKPSGRILGTLVETLTDFDRDGYGLIGRLRDPDLFDAKVYPYALDLPGNGIDEDGVGGDLPAGSPPYQEPAGPGPKWVSTPPVVLVALESFRADAFGAHLGGRPVTPILDALAHAGASSAHAYSHNGYTVQSRHHFFAGSLVGLRGATTLIDDFNAAGYETAYFSGQDESFGGADMDVGFGRASVSYDARQDRDRRYSTFSTAGSLAVPHDVLEGRVAEFLKKRSAVRPLFLYVNFHDTHFPYHHKTIEPLLEAPVLEQSEITPDRAADVRAMYLNTAANVDAAIGRVLGAVRQAVGREPAVIVLSDHGESLFDEGFLGHGYALNEAQTRIPFIVSGLPMRIVEPFGQGELRDAVRASLAETDTTLPPHVEQDDQKLVFQYLGAIDHPAQIGLVGSPAACSTTFDRRARALAMARGPGLVSWGIPTPCGLRISSSCGSR
jgi:hypothetical protein